MSREDEVLRSYERHGGAFDELLAADGSVRPGWRGVLDAFARMSAEARRAAQDKAQRLLFENGVTFVARGEAEGSRPWRLDLFPLLVDPAEWAAIERGVSQRARLLNALLGDLYGSRRVLAEGALPPGVVFGNPQFLRPCSGIAVRKDLYMHFVAFDLARAADGRWWVLGDRTQAPSGLGYALENRVVASQSLPELFAANPVRRLASFFRSFTDHFLSLSSRDQPRAVFLSPGPTRQNYFEHAYLARYLGVGVVEGSDLTVREGRVYLKTVGGLKPVDLILRRISAELCDPLELRTDSVMGVPGLLQAARAGEVTIANALGSGAVESPALLPFLPALSRFFLGEELALPNVPSLWCGWQPSRDRVLGRLDELALRRVSAPRGQLGADQRGFVPEQTARESRERLIEEIQRRGYDFVGQERLSLSSAPVWSGAESLRAAPLTLRVYVAATANGYEVMPGGLARVAAGAFPGSARLDESDVSKDTWVLSDQPVEHFSLLAQRERERPRRGGRDLPSRAADNLFWLGRYTERAEGAVRLFRSLVIRLGGEMGSTRNLVSPERVVSMLMEHRHLSMSNGRRAMQEGREAVERELRTILFDPECRDGLATVVGNVRRTAEAVRERLSFDTFRILKDLTHIGPAQTLAAGRETDDALRLLNRLIQYLAAFNGMVMENMTRGFGWRFLDMGRRIERLRLMMALLLQLAVRGEPRDDGALELLLELADSTMTYRARYQAAPQLPAVLDLLLCDESNPRSAAFQIVTLSQHVAELPRAEDGALAPDEQIITQLGHELGLADPVQLGAAGGAEARTELDLLAQRIDRGVHQLSDLIAERFFSHSAPQAVAGARGRQR